MTVILYLWFCLVPLESKLYYNKHSVFLVHAKSPGFWPIIAAEYMFTEWPPEAFYCLGNKCSLSPLCPICPRLRSQTICMNLHLQIPVATPCLRVCCCCFPGMPPFAFSLGPGESGGMVSLLDPTQFFACVLHETFPNTLTGSSACFYEPLKVILIILKMPCYGVCSLCPFPSGTFSSSAVAGPTPYAKATESFIQTSLFPILPFFFPLKIFSTSLILRLKLYILLVN